MGWYLLYCKPGQEEVLIRSCKAHLSGDILEDAFQLSYDRMKKYLGEWHVDTYPMFPRYVFLQSGKPELLSRELEQFRGITEVLEQKQMLLSVKPEEERAIRMLCGTEHHMRLSRAKVQNGEVHMVDGPLKGREYLIRKLDLHRRIAVLNLRLNEEGKDIWAGIELEQR